MNYFTNTPKMVDNPRGARLGWLLLAILAHSAWGAYPVLVRYMQNTHSLATMSLASTTNLSAALVLWIAARKKIDLRKLKPSALAFFSIFVIARGGANFFSSRYTHATTVQLLSLLSPFVVAFLATTLLKETLARFTIPALLLSVGGSVLMILGASKASGGALIPASNGIGIGIAALGGIMLAFYTLGVKMIGAKGASPETLAILQFLSLGLFMGTGSLAMGEDWSPWLRLAPSGILSFFAFVFGVLLLGTILQNNVLRHIEAAVYSTFQAWRLVATISMSWLILGEGISTLLQVMGALVVIGSVTFYTLANNKKRIQGESAK